MGAVALHLQAPAPHDDGVHEAGGENLHITHPGPAEGDGRVILLMVHLMTESVLMDARSCCS